MTFYEYSDGVYTMHACDGGYKQICSLNMFMEIRIIPTIYRF